MTFTAKVAILALLCPFTSATDDETTLLQMNAAVHPHTERPHHQVPHGKPITHPKYENKVEHGKHRYETVGQSKTAHKLQHGTQHYDNFVEDNAHNWPSHGHAKHRPWKETNHFESKRINEEPSERDVEFSEDSEYPDKYGEGHKRNSENFERNGDTWSHRPSEGVKHRPWHSGHPMHGPSKPINFKPDDETASPVDLANATSTSQTLIDDFQTGQMKAADEIEAQSEHLQDTIDKAHAEVQETHGDSESADKAKIAEAEAALKKAKKDYWKHSQKKEQSKKSMAGQSANYDHMDKASESDDNGEDEEDDDWGKGKEDEESEKAKKFSDAVAARDDKEERAYEEYIKDKKTARQKFEASERDLPSTYPEVQDGDEDGGFNDKSASEEEDPDEEKKPMRDHLASLGDKTMQWKEGKGPEKLLHHIDKRSL